MSFDEQDASSASEEQNPETVESESQDETAELSTEAEESAPSDNESESQDETEAESEPAKPQDRGKPRETPAERRIKQLLAENKRLKQQVSPPARKDEPKLEEPKRPNEKDFDDYDKLETAREDYRMQYAAYVAKKAVAEDRAAQAKARDDAETAQKEQELTESWSKRVKATIARNPEFKVGEAIDAVRANPALDGFIVDSDIGPDLLLHLQAHPEEADRLRELAPYATVRAATKLEDQLLDQIKGNKRQPKPPRYVNGGGNGPAKARHLENILYGD